MAKFVPKEKLGKKARKELDRQRRITWGFSPVTKTVDSGKIYSRKRKARYRDDYGPGFFAAFRLLPHRFRVQDSLPGASNSLPEAA